MNAIRVASFPGLSALTLLALAVPSTRLGATDFLRGDTNGDGEVSLADAQCVQLHLFAGLLCIRCDDAADSDGTGTLTFTDALRTAAFAVLGELPPAPPFPEVGPDPSEDEIGCETYPFDPSVEDPAARLGIASAWASPSTGGNAIITLTISHSLVILGYSGRIVDDHHVLSDSISPGTSPPYRTPPHVVLNELRLMDRSHGRPPEPATFLEARVKDGVLTFGVLGDLFASAALLPPEEDELVLEIRVPLEAGTPPGSYPLTLESAELVQGTNVVRPELVSGVLEVRAHDRFVRGDCNGDGELIGSPTDAIFLLNYNFSGTKAPPCLAACDANGDGAVIGQVSDAIYLLDFNFLGGPPPLSPFPDCGPGALEGDLQLGCEAPPECP